MDKFYKKSNKSSDKHSNKNNDKFRKKNDSKNTIKKNILPMTNDSNPIYIETKPSLGININDLEQNTKNINLNSNRSTNIYNQNFSNYSQDNNQYYLTNQEQQYYQTNQEQQYYQTNQEQQYQQPIHNYQQYQQPIQQYQQYQQPIQQYQQPIQQYQQEYHQQNYNNRSIEKYGNQSDEEFLEIPNISVNNNNKSSKNMQSNHMQSNQNDNNLVNDFFSKDNELREAENILNLSGDYNKNDLNTNYKKLAFINHPDKGGNKYIFDLIVKSYQIINTDLSRRQKIREETPVYNSKYNPNNAIHKDGGSFQNIHLNKDKFNINKFNEVFEQINKNIDDPNNRGYGSSMVQSSKNRDDPNISRIDNINKNNFNEIFIKNNNNAVTVYRDPEFLLSNASSNFSELGVEEINDFSGKNYTDYQRAFQQEFINPDKFDIPRYRNIEEYKNFRDRNIMENVDEFKKQEESMKELERQREDARIKMIQRQDDLYRQNFEQFNRMFIR